MRGADYNRAAKRMRDSGLWSLEETLAGYCVGAKAQLERWEPEYRGYQAKLRGAMQQDDLQALSAAIDAWPFFPGDPSLNEARGFIVTLKDKETGQEAGVSEAVKSNDAQSLRKALGKWAFPHDTAVVKSARELLAHYNDKRRNTATHFENRDLPRLKKALEEIPLQTRDADIMRAHAAVEEWAARIEELKPKVDQAMEAKDVPALEKALEGLDITTDDETLPMAFAALQGWKPKYYRARAELEHAKTLGVDKVNEMIAHWEWSPEDPMLARARTYLTDASAAEKRLETAIHEKRVADISKIIDNWKYGQSHQVKEAREALKVFRQQLASVQRAMKAGDVARIEAALSALPWEADGDPDIEKAKSMAKEFSALKHAIDDAIAAGIKADVEAATSGWKFGPKDEPVLKAKEFLGKYTAEEKKLAFLVGSKADPKDIVPLRTALLAWPFDRFKEPTVVAAQARVDVYDATAPPLKAAIETKNMGQLMEALGDWEFPQSDPLYAEAMAHIDAFGAQIKVVRAAVEAKVGADFASALAQLEYEADDDMDIAELRMYAKAYAKKVSGLQTAMDNGDVDAVQELLDEWDFAEDPILDTARAFVESGGLPPPAAENEEPPADAEASGAGEEEAPAAEEAAEE
jgi:hypothetical protein